MSYVFGTPGRLAFEIRRVATETLDDALEQLGPGLAGDPAEAIHAARKDLKKTRSLLRLAKSSLGDERFRAENERLRAAAHHLAGAREADALSESLAALIESKRDAMSVEAVAGVRRWQSRMDSGKTAKADLSFAAAQASALIEAARAEARTWALGYGSFGLIEPGIRRTYRQGRRHLRRAAEDPSEETLHEWRKRVKDMWYSLRLLGQVWEPMIRPLADQAHELSDLLGDHHDLGELRLAVEAGESALSATSREELLSVIADRQAELHEAAISLGRRLYAEGPRRYTGRLAALWDAWALDSVRHVGQDGFPGSYSHSSNASGRGSPVTDSISA